MNVHEYQGKEILRRYGVATPRGMPCFSVSEADAAARELGGKVWVVKAQIHAGGRGKGGGVKVAKSLEEVHEYAAKILGMTLGDASDRTRGPAREAPAGGGGRRHPQGTLRRHGRRSCLAARHADGEFRGRHGDRRSRRPHAGKNTQGRDRSRRGPDRCAGGRGGAQDRHTAGLDRAGPPVHAGPVPRLRRMRCLARRDQSRSSSPATGKCSRSMPN